MRKSLLKFQIGPVQDFIAQARSTRDLWSGSYLLSWLVAAGIRQLISENGELIFPSQEGQPLLDDKLNSPLANSPTGTDLTALLTPNLPNLFIAEVPAENAADLARSIEKAIRDEWKSIADAVWKNRDKFSLNITYEKRFYAQVEKHLSIAWNITPFPENESYADVYAKNGKQLDAVRQTRDFSAWDSTPNITPAFGVPLFQRDSLSGKEEALIGGTNYRDEMAKCSGKFSHLFEKHSDHLGTVQIIKRCWHLAYLKAEKNINADSNNFPIASIPDIAARLLSKVAKEKAVKNQAPDDERNPRDQYDQNPKEHEQRASSDSYFAAIAFDGDQIGKWVSGEFLAEGANLQAHHQAFSTALSTFAMGARKIVEKHEGFLIYAGGDDVVALTPAHTALQCAKELREFFVDNVKFTGANNEKPDASAGITIAHINSPLQDAIRNAQKAEKRAKNTIGRPAFSLCLMKRSGEITEWGSKWTSGGYELFEKILKFLKEEKLSARFPHRICQFLAPYLGTLANNPTLNTEDKQKNHHISPEDIIPILHKEIAHTIKQQATGISENESADLNLKFSTYLQSLLNEKKVDATTEAKFTTPDILLALDGLCTAVAFAARTLPANCETTTNQSTEQPAKA